MSIRDNALRKVARQMRRAIDRNKTLASELISAIHGFSLHAKHSFPEQNKYLDAEQLKFYIIKHCHIVEKGMALPSPRDAFGQPKIKDLIAKTKLYEVSSRGDAPEVVRDTLRKYRDIHKGKEHLFAPDFICELNSFVDMAPPKGKGGLTTLRKQLWDKWSLEAYEEFIDARHSVRNFSCDPVDQGSLESAILVGLKAPSVCNRQGWNVHSFADRVKMKELLSYQNGNAGFSDVIDKLLIVTGNLKAFTKHEQNQLFVDGGLLSMNLMLSLHAAGFGACPLNTCMPYWKEKKLLLAASIPFSQRLIMMIAVGNLKAEFAVAQSYKFTCSDVLIKH
jgi:nitroreductase